MTEIEKLVDDMPYEAYERLVSAVELGKWQDGAVLSQEQRENCLQLVMLYQARKLDNHEHFTIAAGGKLNELSKAELKKQFKGESIAEFKNEQL